LKHFHCHLEKAEPGAICVGFLGPLATEGINVLVAIADMAMAGSRALLARHCRGSAEK